MSYWRADLWFVFACFLPACMATAPIHPEAKRHNQAGVAYLQTGSLSEAEVCFQLSLEYNPCHADSLHNLALIHLLRGELATAEKQELEALSCRPDLVQAVSGLGVIRHRRGDRKEALELFEQAVGMDPGYLDARRNLILAAVALGKLELARTHANRLRILTPKDPFVDQVTGMLEGNHQLGFPVVEK